MNVHIYVIYQQYIKVQYIYVQRLESVHIYAGYTVHTEVTECKVE